MPTCLFVTTLWLLSFVLPRSAWAHDPGLSRGEYAVVTADEHAVVTATLTFARRDVAHAIQDDSVDPARIAAVFARGTMVRGDGGDCPTRLAEAAPFESDGVRLVLVATCASPPRVVTLEAAWLASLPFAHRHLARAEGLTSDTPLTISKRVFSFAVRSSSAAASAAPVTMPPRTFFFGMGVQHILTGYDHLVFLLGLLLLASTARQLLLVVTAFTLGHSISLALATLGVLVPSTRLVEPLIALSIAWVGVENLFAPSPAKRWRITLPFGLIHGFGFASALRDLALPRSELPWALGLFNLGVEVGQLAVIAVAVPLLVVARRRGWLDDRVVKALSVGVAVAGLAWFVARVVT